ncbi:MAG: GIY-YIG nuclease family protein [Desulfomonilaceae bacterium]
MIIRCTQKLLAELKIGLMQEPSDNDPFWSWHANVFHVERRKCVLITNDMTLFTMLIPGLKTPDFKSFHFVIGEHLFKNLLYENIPQPQSLTRTRVHRNNRNSMTPWQVYLLRCSDDSLYCGATTDIERRLLEHNRGAGARYTRSRLPVRLVWSSDELTKSAAFREEYRIKRLSKLIKEELVDGGRFREKSPSEER